MGQEIDKITFTAEDEEIFRRKLREETKILKRWFKERAFDDTQQKTNHPVHTWSL